ncbi:MAG: DUF1080 domain-containing protein [Cyclobacteriaceae bacterium]
MKKSIFILTAVLITFNCYSQENKMLPQATEVWEPEPRVIQTSELTSPPSDAIVLFDGSNLDEWESDKGGSAKWELKDNAMTVNGTGGIKTKRSFGDVQLHIEWRTPSVVKGEGQGRGNSGVFLQSKYEVQVLDNYNNRTYSNGQAGGIYKQTMPLVNACKAPGEWQVYDIIYKAPVFNKDGIKTSSAYITVLHNGVLIQNHTEIKGTTPYIGLPQNPAHGKLPLSLQDHNNPVSYRNVWVREL